jgi:hypothetical protein
MDGVIAIGVRHWADADDSDQPPFDPYQLAAGIPPPPPGSLVLPSSYFTYPQSGRLIFGKLRQTKSYFCRGSAVVRIVGDELSAVTPAELQSVVDSHGHVYIHAADTHGAIVLKPRRCTESSAKVLLASDIARAVLPPIEAVSSGPVIVQRGDTTAVLEKGYHPDAGGVFVRGGGVEGVPLEAAAESLKGLLVDYDFVTPADRSRALAAIVTPALKVGGLLTEPCPVDMVEADSSQSGKTYLQKCTRAIYGESAHLLTKRSGGVGSLDESLAAGLLGGRPFIALDNVRGTLDSQLLEAVLTWGGDVSCRVPYRGEVRVKPTAVTLQLSSNGLEATRDLVNRSSIVRIRKRHGLAFSRWTPGGDLLGHIQARQPYFLGCVFALVSAWVEAGKPRTDDLRHDMRAWAQSLDWIVQHLLDEAPLMDGHARVQERASDPVTTWVRQLALRLIAADCAGLWKSATAIVDFCLEDGVPIMELRDVTSPNVPMVVGQRMRKLFRGTNRIELDGMVLERRTTLYDDRDHRKVRELPEYRVVVARHEIQPEHEPPSPSNHSPNTSAKEDAP